MSAERSGRAPLPRFLDSFFGEGSIKWLLVTGVLILVGSSLMLVTASWHTYTPLWKYVTVFAYTAAAAGERASTAWDCVARDRCS